MTEQSNGYLTMSGDLGTLYTCSNMDWQDARLAVRQQMVAEADLPAIVAALLAAEAEVLAAMPRQAAARERVAEASDAVQLAGADVLLRGGVDGKNAEIRAAQLTVAQSMDPGYLEAAAALAEARAAQAVADGECEAGRIRYNTSKARLAAATAMLTVLAG